MDYINLEQWSRKEHFQFFSGIALPFYNVTTSLDVTAFHAYVKANGLSFYYALIYATLMVMNTHTDFLYKIRGDKIVRHQRLEPSFVVLNEATHLLKIVDAPLSGTMADFCRIAAEKVAEQQSYFPSDAEEARDDLVYFSCTPWFSFTSLTNETDLNRDDSIPRITWGKYEKKDGRLTIPYAMQLNHRLLDGYHVGLLVNGLQAYIDALA